MRLRARANRQPARRRVGESGFTLAEVLAALLFMAIVIPVAVQGLRVASLAGEVAERKTQAARVAERILNEVALGTNSYQTSLTGTAVEGVREFRWTLRSEPWDQLMTNRLPIGTSLNQLGGGQPAVDQFAASQVEMNLVTVEVTYPVQNDEYKVRLSTLTETGQ